MYKYLKVTSDVAHSVLTVSMNRPEVKNCVSPAVATELFQSFLDFDRTPELKVAILHGVDTFCAGFDLKSISQESMSSLVPGELEQRGPMGPTRLRLSKPVIAAVEGYAVAGGLELALWCDLVVSHKEAVFGVFCRRFGVPLIDGGTVRLARVVGVNRARDLVLTGRPILGEEAHSWGLVNRLAPNKSAVLIEALKLAYEITRHPFDCVMTDKASLEEAAFPQLYEDLINEKRHGQRALASPQLMEALANFVTKSYKKPKL